jgi:hypothetical protein
MIDAGLMADGLYFFRDKHAPPMLGPANPTQSRAAEMSRPLTITIICALGFGAGFIAGRLSAPPASQSGQTQPQSQVYGRYGYVAPSTFEGVPTKPPQVIDLNQNK